MKKKLETEEKFTNAFIRGYAGSFVNKLFEYILNVPYILLYIDSKLLFYQYQINSSIKKHYPNDAVEEIIFKLTDFVILRNFYH